MEWMNKTFWKLVIITIALGVASVFHSMSI